MIEITPVVVNENRFLGLVIHLPKCTMRLLFNMKLIVLDSCFDLIEIERKCPVPLIQCSSSYFEKMLNENIIQYSERAYSLGIRNEMKVKEAIECVFSQKETSEELF